MVLRLLPLRCYSISIVRNFLRTKCERLMIARNQWRLTGCTRTFASDVGEKGINHNVIDKPNEFTDDFRMIYKFPYIVHVRALCRLKIYQTILTSLSIPIIGILVIHGDIEVNGFYSALAVTGVANVMIYVMGSFFRSLIGMIYLNEKLETVKISHLTFWGGRLDIEMPVTDIVPFSDGNDNVKNVYWTLKRYSAPKVKLYYFNVNRFGGIIEKEMFFSVFGSFY